MTQQEPILQSPEECLDSQEKQAPTAADLEQTQAGLPHDDTASNQPAQPQEQPQPAANADKCLKERLYDKVNVPIWVLDLIIGGCILAIVYCLIVGRS